MPFSGLTTGGNQSSANPNTGVAHYNNQALGQFPLTPDNIGLNNVPCTPQQMMENFSRVSNALMRVQAQVTHMWNNTTGGGGGGGTTGAAVTSISPATESASAGTTGSGVTGYSPSTGSPTKDTDTPGVTTGTAIASFSFDPATCTFSYTTDTFVKTVTGTFMTDVHGTFLTALGSPTTATFVKTITYTRDTFSKP